MRNFQRALARHLVSDVSVAQICNSFLLWTPIVMPFALIMQFQLAVVLFQLHLVYCRAPLFFIFLFDRTDQHVVEKEILVVRLVVHDVLFDHLQTRNDFVQV